MVIFDGHCRFCCIWVDYWRARTGDRVDYEASEEASPESVRMVLPDGEVLSGARAVYELLRYSHGSMWPLYLYRALPGFAGASELSYRFIAGHRSLFYRLTVLLFGKRIRPATYEAVEWLFLRSLAVIYLTAFVSLGVQVRGLIGSRGILPVGSYLDAGGQALGARAWMGVPTLFWIAHGDGLLTWSCIAGAAIAVVLMLGFFDRACLVLLYVLYLSLCSVGQDFLSFQWDMLLLESGFLAIFLGSSRLVIWLFRLLVFRLMFSSGAVKLLSGDPAWRSLRALQFHYFTQPIPTPLAWYFEQLPDWFHRYSTVGVFAIELAVPFMIFMPRRARMFGASCLILLQVLILTTGNYAFFNWLSIALCLFLFDDGVFREWLPRRRGRGTPRRVAIAVAVMVIGLGVLQMLATLGRPLHGAGAAVLGLAAPFGIVNSYGLFAVMTTTRDEIAVQGSNDGVNWMDYEFKYKAGPLNRRPPWVAPHQPRLDWQMWFAALGAYQNNPWFVNFMVRLLEGSPEVLKLLEKNPFPNAPPRYIRAVTSSYRFTDWKEWRATGNWWKADAGGEYLRAISLADVRRRHD